MKLGKTALLEIVNIVLDGLANNKDISAKLRELDLVTSGPFLTELSDLSKAKIDDAVLELSQPYTEKHPRAGDWNEKN